MKTIAIKHPTQLELITEKELIKGCLDGKENYYKKLYDTFCSKMFNICLRYAKDRAEAQDLLQEGFIKVFKNLDQYGFKGSFEGWMRRIFVTTAINYYRKNNSRNLTDYLDNEMLLSIGSTDSFHTENYMDHDFEAKDLLSFIQELPPAYKTVFNLFAIEEYSHKEIAEILGISEGASRSNLSKARAKLQEIIIPLMEPDRLSYTG